MTAQFTRLRIAGFKSFAEPVSLDILPGLTGIVGPNGCGKSNVVEALRWAMGETSARSLRGGEMDDVIFAGTHARASRNLAEVTITLGGTLPSPFEAEAELQVTRRIERGAGSQFRANGRDLRARDVQTLYADLASGARSSGMVSQGRVSALVNARPEERRQVLEEAAGITGLHARRHEAELKLRAAEQNLSRAEDLRTQLEGTLDGLRKQARQAVRYRTISSLIRSAEAEHLGILHAQATAALRDAEAAHEAAGAEAARTADEVATLGAALAEAEAGVPAPREAEAAARSTLERRRVEAEGLAAEAERLASEAADAAARLQDLEADLAAAAGAQADAGASVARLQQEADRLSHRQQALPGEIENASMVRDTAARTAAAARQQADAAASHASEATLLSRQAAAAQAAAQHHHADLVAQLAAARADHDAGAAGLIPAASLSAADADVAAAELALAAARAASQEAETGRAEAVAALYAAGARHERESAACHTADRAVDDAEGRVRRLREATAAARENLAALEAARVDPARLAAAQDAARADEAALHACERRLEEAEKAASASTAAHAEAMRQADDARAARPRIDQQIAEQDARVARIAAEAQAAEAALADAERTAPAAADLHLAEAARLAAMAASAAQQSALDRLQQGRQQAEQALTDAREAAFAADALAARLAAEADGLAASLGEDSPESGLLAGLTVPDGLEFAVATALGEGCDASLDAQAPRFWRSLAGADDPPALPPGSAALAALVPPPAPLRRLFAHVAVLDDATDGTLLQAGLAPGIVIVNRAGACWRWDGYVRAAGLPNPAAIRLRQRRHLAATRTACAAAEDEAAAARGQVDACARDAESARGWEEAARVDANRLEAAARAAASDAASLAARLAQADARRAALLPSLHRLRQEQSQAGTALDEARAAATLLADPAALDQQAREAAGQADAAAASLQAARTARQTARDRLEAAGIVARDLAAADLAAQGRIDAARLILVRVEQDLEAALARAALALAERAALPDPRLARDDLASAVAAEAEARTEEAAARARLHGAAQSLDAARRDAARLHASHVAVAGHLAGLAAALTRLQADCQRAAEQAEAAAASIAALPDLAALSALAQQAAGQSALASDDLARLELSLAALRSESQQTDARHAVTVQELQAWQARMDAAQARASALSARVASARALARLLVATPADMADRAARSAEALSGAEAAHAGALDRMQAAEQRARGLAAAQRDAEQRAAACRERLVRTEATREGALGALQAVLARAADRLGVDAQLPDGIDSSDSAEERARRKCERLTREREEMGPVNLRAELEVAELDQRIASLDLEREELGSAIAKLRGSIGHLNREGRERLAAVFTQVDQHFRALFTRTMGGGRAHLALTGSEDPLQAGLEIYAEPPGKKLSSLSLLSGGEQALTALSLIFAVFRCTPAPVSVLDEVDAPLDDANVERFCTLLDDMVRQTGTRFLVVTHHQTTMSRMDRLFGVTMQERGVSRLLSVDLSRAVAMVEPTLQAAE